MTIFSLLSLNWAQSFSENISHELINISAKEVMIVSNHELGGYTYSDTTYISVSKLLPPCDDGYTEIDSSCYYQSDLDVLQEFIDNSSVTINMDMDMDNSGIIEPLELCSHNIGTGSVYQNWDNGRLNSFYCTDVGLIGEIPGTIGDLTNLEILGLRYNLISGRIPESIGDITDLETLLLNNNQLTYKIPESICNLDLDFLIFWNNKLCPPYPECITEEELGYQDTSECIDCPDSIEGDTNYDGYVNIIDIVLINNCILSNDCDECSDLNFDGNIDILDIMLIINIIFDI